MLDRPLDFCWWGGGCWSGVQNSKSHHFCFTIIYYLLFLSSTLNVEKKMSMPIFHTSPQKSNGSYPNRIITTKHKIYCQIIKYIMVIYLSQWWENNMYHRLFNQICGHFQTFLVLILFVLLIEMYRCVVCLTFF